MKSFIKKNWPIISILMLSAFLRLYKIADYMTFLGDEGRDALVIYNILHGKLTLLGPTASVGGFFLGPIYYYFMAIFTLLFNYSPVGPSVMVALFGIATVFLVYKVTNEFFGKRAGVIASLLYASSPLVVAYSRSSWNPNPLPFFSLLTLYFLYKAVLSNRKKLFIFCGFLLGISIQLHYLTIFLGVIVFFYVFFANAFLIKEKSSSVYKTFTQFILLFIGFLIGWSPFLAFEVRHGFPNITSIFNFIFHSGETGGNINFFATIQEVLFRLFARLVFAFPSPDQISSINRSLISTWEISISILAFLSITILLFKFWQSFSKKEDFAKYLLFFTWLFFGVMLFGFYKKSIYDYYFGFMFPLPFILSALTISFLSKRIPKGIFLAIILTTALFLINIQGIPFRYQPNRQLEQVRKISEFIYEKAEGKPFNFALMTGGNSDHAYRYFFTIWGSPSVAIQDPQKDPERKTVTDQLLIVCESFPCYPLGNSLWEIAGFGRAEIIGSWDVSVVKVFKLKHYEEK
ncbi:MAG: glycosyltransferase family 39 protein [Candidatus Levyibacteriota bacterium]